MASTSWISAQCWPNTVGVCLALWLWPISSSEKSYDPRQAASQGAKPLVLSLMCSPGEVVRELIIDVAAWEMTRMGRTERFLDPEISLSF